MHAHNHTNIQKRESYILLYELCSSFFFNIDFQRSNGRFTFNEKN